MHACKLTYVHVLAMLMHVWAGMHAVQVMIACIRASSCKVRCMYGWLCAGGSAVASDAIHREVKRLRDNGTPVVVSMGNVAASGGYYISGTA